MVGMGKKLMAEGQSMYAEKFFAKAITTLDTVKQEMDGLVSEGEKEDYVGSVAMCLSWAAIAQLVQGGSPRECPYLKRLAEPQFIPFTTEPMSEASRAVTIQQLMLAAPKTWTGETCSRTKLSALLEKNPQDHDSRSMLVITLFLSGDLERCLTEALKLQVLGVDFGRVAVKKVSAFLGEDHTLVQQLGTSKASQS
ncbi:hypothetical protein AGDE_05027 [Angomonas deanei]|nr:hypothetical protein AGDE_05027 [Angomonas deanei]|eukprot:EPY38902.1 hypothetical protein AGDE_05027 [Angomonas deanei]